MGDGLDILDPKAQKASFAGADVVVRPLGVGQILAVRRALEGVDLSQGFTPAAIPDLLLQHGDAVLEALAVALKLSRQQLEEADPEQLLELFATVVEVNADFFVHRFMPRLQGLVAKLAKLESPSTGNGRTPSMPSSAPGTA